MAKQPVRPDTSAATETPEQTAARLAPGKGAPTPTRKQQEAARRRPLVPEDRKLAARQARAQAAETREKARLGMAAGDERYLPMRDRGPQKRFVRDYVDARFNVGEFMIPVMFVIIILTMFPQPEVQVYGILFLWTYFIVSVIDCVLLGFRLNKLVQRKFPGRPERIRWYAAMRALQLRLMRMPRPQVKRGQFPA